jgi:nucleoside-diphosphate-sugar epimerase
MRVLVTGSSGFIGSHLVRALREKQYEVLCFSSKDGDIANITALDSFQNIDHVYHLAARTFVPDSWDNVYDYFRVNIMGLVTSLEFCRKKKCPITVVSTYVYGDPQYLPIDEKHPVVAASPYHESKIVGENICAFYSNAFSIKVTILRVFNVYGEGQNERFLIPKIYSQANDDSIKEISVLDLKPRRDFIYIDDVIAALLLSLRAPKPYAVYNVGIGVSASVEEVIQGILRVTGISKSYRSTNIKRPSEIPDCVADISLIRTDLGFVPKFTLLDGLAKFHGKRGIKSIG